MPLWFQVSWLDDWVPGYAGGSWSDHHCSVQQCFYQHSHTSGRGWLDITGACISAHLGIKYWYYNNQPSCCFGIKGNEKEAIQIALVHLCFNITGIILFYPVPFMRWPIPLAQKLGDITSRYRWFSIAYLSLMFFIFPTIVFGLSLAGPVVMYVVLIPTATIILLVIFINLLQSNKPELLPRALADWSFLPEPLRSLDPLDRVITTTFSYCSKAKITTEEHDLDDNKKQHKEEVNKGFEQDFV